MSELSEQARRAMDRLREDRPSPEQRARLRARITAAAALTSLGASASAAGATQAGAGPAIVLGTSKAAGTTTGSAAGMTGAAHAVPGLGIKLMGLPVAAKLACAAFLVATATVLPTLYGAEHTDRPHDRAARYERPRQGPQPGHEFSGPRPAASQPSPPVPTQRHAGSPEERNAAEGLQGHARPRGRLRVRQARKRRAATTSEAVVERDALPQPDSASPHLNAPPAAPPSAPSIAPMLEAESAILLRALAALESRDPCKAREHLSEYAQKFGGEALLRRERDRLAQRLVDFERTAQAGASCAQKGPLP